MLMTALAACIGLLPAAMSTGIGSQVQRPLATVVVGGMLIGPIMLLLVVPALQTMVLRAQPDDRAGHQWLPCKRNIKSENEPASAIWLIYAYDRVACRDRDRAMCRAG